MGILQRTYVTDINGARTADEAQAIAADYFRFKVDTCRSGDEQPVYLARKYAAMLEAVDEGRRSPVTRAMVAVEHALQRPASASDFAGANARRPSNATATSSDSRGASDEASRSSFEASAPLGEGGGGRGRTARRPSQSTTEGRASARTLFGATSWAKVAAARPSPSPATSRLRRVLSRSHSHPRASSPPPPPVPSPSHVPSAWPSAPSSVASDPQGAGRGVGTGPEGQARPSYRDVLLQTER